MSGPSFHPERVWPKLHPTKKRPDMRGRPRSPAAIKLPSVTITKPEAPK